MSLINLVDNVEKEPKHYLSDNTVFIYWSHHLETFDYLKIQDNRIFHVELRLLCRQLHSGVIKNISAGEPLIVDGKTLQTIEVAITTTKCVPYTLLHKKEIFNMQTLRHTCLQVSVTGTKHFSTSIKT